MYRIHTEQHPDEEGNDCFRLTNFRPDLVLRRIHTISLFFWGG